MAKGSEVDINSVAEMLALAKLQVDSILDRISGTDPLRAAVVAARLRLADDNNSSCNTACTCGGGGGGGGGGGNCIAVNPKNR